MSEEPDKQGKESEIPKPLIVRDPRKIFTVAQIDPDKYYSPMQLGNLAEYLAFYTYPRMIYRHLKRGKIDCIEIESTGRRLIQGQDFLDFMGYQPNP